MQAAAAGAPRGAPSLRAARRGRASRTAQPTAQADAASSAVNTTWGIACQETSCAGGKGRPRSAQGRSWGALSTPGGRGGWVGGFVEGGRVGGFVEGGRVGGFVVIVAGHVTFAGSCGG